GGWLFDDYPNIVDNKNLQIQQVDVASLTRAAMSSPSSSFKRPLASLSFAANYLASGLHPYWWKVTNLIIHLLNGLLVFLLAWQLLRCVDDPVLRLRACGPTLRTNGNHPDPGFDSKHASVHDSKHPVRPERSAAESKGVVAALIAAAWMLLPINLTAVLYVVQRMESAANLFVLLGLLGYMAGRTRMLAGKRGLWLCAVSLTVPTAIGLLFKETAVMLPLYALLIEWLVLHFARQSVGETQTTQVTSALANPLRRDWRIAGLFVIFLLLPMIAGLAWLLPGVLQPGTWATRDFTLHTRLLSEARIVVDYLAWSLLPTPQHLSFYHDYFHISTGLLKPWTTLACILILGLLVAAIFWFRRRRPLVALGLALFLGCHLLTGTILPLELIYEHRNYFASFGLLLAVIPLLAAPAKTAADAASSRLAALPMALPRYSLLCTLFLWWIALTAFTAYAWGDPLRLASDLATRGPTSPRAQYELGRTLLIYSKYDPNSPYTPLVYAPLERAAALPDASILPEQALIFMNAHLHKPIKDAWWASMIAKLKAKAPGVQDESSLSALSKCAIKGGCALSHQRMVDAFMAALSHPDPHARLLASYADYAWNVLNDQALGVRMARATVKTDPSEPVYHVTLARMCLVLNDLDCAREQIKALQQMNLGGSLDPYIHSLNHLLESRQQ
ncbi:MAG: hypothetical protein L0H70_04850, partial [Xanthomonadales bacterium]|nr:hypothetical protein [Xanthomonadales bacterium]